MTYTIVAIPSKDDPVWKVSSEKIPHLTLMVLGDNLPNPLHTLDFLEHVIDTTLCRFMLDVDRRDVLGPKNADVLFFKKYCVKNLENFQANLLKNTDILAAYNSETQYPEWVPHLTLGYPETPAHSDGEYPIQWVNFDKIALWTEDYSGPEILLKDNYEPYVEMSSSSKIKNMTPEEALVHFGVKGMHWGQRNVGVKTQTNAPRVSGYSDQNVNLDSKKFGSRGVDRINQHMINGLDYESARKKEQNRQLKKRLLIAGSIYAASMLLTHGPGLAQNVANDYVAKKGAATAAKAAANLLADSRGIGSHKIVDLGYNAATGVWG